MQRPPHPAAIPVPSRPELPRHIGIIMDGNGRWARRRHLPRNVGHRAGVRAIRPVMEACDALGVHILTVYAFSTENWGRPRSEVSALMRLFEETIDREIDELNANGVQVRIMGRREELGQRLQRKIAQAETLTERNTTAVLNVAINYGGRAEIVDAVRELARSGTDLTQLDEAGLSRSLYSAGLPDPDLVIRTAGEMRLSNFLLWQASYSELFVSPVCWPEFRKAELHEALRAYASRKRKFGGLEQDADAAEARSRRSRRGA
jgi:undecaprenyl diphosphate synthase